MGYQHGKTVFDVWSRSGVVEKMLKDRHQEEFYNTQSKNNVREGKPHANDVEDVIRKPLRIVICRDRIESQPYVPCALPI